MKKKNQRKTIKKKIKNIIIHRIAYIWKAPIFVTCTVLMPFLDEHTDKVMMAFMAIFAIDESYKSYNKK